MDSDYSFDSRINRQYMKHHHKRDNLRPWTIGIVLILVGFASASAQEGTLSLKLFPSSTQVRIAGVIYDSDEVASLRLPAGKTIIEYWAPKFKTVRDTLTIIQDSTLVLGKALITFEESYKNYSELSNDRMIYKVSTSMQGVGFGLLIGAVAYSGYSHDSMWEESYNAALLAKDQHENLALSQAAVVATREAFDRAVAEFEERKAQHNNIRVATTVFTTVASGALIYYLSRRKKNTPVKPDFEIKEPFSGVTVEPILGYETRNLVIGTTLKF